MSEFEQPHDLPDTTQPVLDTEKTAIALPEPEAVFNPPILETIQGGKKSVEPQRQHLEPDALKRAFTALGHTATVPRKPTNRYQLPYRDPALTPEKATSATIIPFPRKRR